MYVQNFSHGMKKRLQLLLSLLADPDIIIRDEPTNGLDPQGNILVKQLITTLQSQNKTLLLSTHNLQDIEQLASHYAILHH